MRKKRTIEGCQEHAESKGGKCISVEYINACTNLEWECKEKHRWFATPNNILNSGTWCPFCVRVTPLNIEICQEHAESKKGKCLSTEYINVHTKLEWECEERHTWFATPNNILNKDRWCPECNSPAPLTIEICQEYAESKKGKCLSTEYINNKTKLEWECEEKHTWFATSSSVFNKECWCPYCVKKAKLTIEICQEYAKSKGGKCLSTEYINNHTKLEWECEEKHRWFAKPHNVLNCGTWCPQCKNKTQKKLTDIIKSIFQDKTVLSGYTGFIWLKNKRTKKHQELDIYIPELKIAIEYDGEQHFGPVRFNGISMKRAKEKYKDQKRRDKRKNRVIKAHPEDVKYFIRIPCADKKKISEKYVKEKLQEAGIEI